MKDDFPFIREFIRLDSVDSTNSFALNSGLAFIAVAARSQTAGRGRRSHTWHSPEGNLFLSITLPGEDTRFTILSGVAVRNAVAEILGSDEIAIKWPNDILFKGRKLSGILCESRAGITAVGIGVNINQTSWPEDIAGKAVSLKQLSGRDYTVEDVEGHIINNLGVMYHSLGKEGFHKIKDLFLKYHVGPEYEPRLIDGTKIEIIDINDDGSLEVEASGRKITLISEEIFFKGYTDL